MTEKKRNKRNKKELEGKKITSEGAYQDVLPHNYVLGSGGRTQVSKSKFLPKSSITL